MMKKFQLSVVSVVLALLVSLPWVIDLKEEKKAVATISSCKMDNPSCCMKNKNELAQMTSCCPMGDDVTASATMQFASLANDQTFVNKHEEPITFTFEGEGQKITFKTSDGREGMGWEIKAKKKTKNYIFVIHEWWGLNDYIKKEAENIANALGNANVIALDLYDGQVASTREDAMKYMQSVKSERAQAIIKGAVEYAGKKANIGTVGWCFGGGWSLQASLILGKQAKACVIYYGMPEKDVEKLKTLNPDVLGIFASQEQYISPKIVAEFEENMKKAGKSVTIKNYDADHAFANPSNPKYNKQFAEEAMALTIAFFKKKLK
jgi:carboxymethylenebutenolidase